MVSLDLLNQSAAPKVDVSVATLFATPVAKTMVPDHVSINRELREIILERERTSTSTRHSNEGGWQSSKDLADWGGPAFQTILNMGKQIADSLTCDRKGQPAKIDWKINSWANVNRKGDANVFHVHQGCFWSACYYVDDGGIGKDPSLGGEFEIRDPRGVAPTMYAPFLAFKTAGGRAGGFSEYIRPVAGLMLVFPSWLDHGVRQYRGNDIRISVAFNLSL